MLSLWNNQLAGLLLAARIAADLPAVARTSPASSLYTEGTMTGTLHVFRIL
jgi:hypothetical protein